MPSPLAALSPLDGRYARTADPAARLLQRAGPHPLPRRASSWPGSQALAAERAIKELKPFSPEDLGCFASLVKNFSERDAEHIKNIEAETNHDVKAIEYWLRAKLAKNAEAQRALEFIHFACTSEDINNLVLRADDRRVAREGDAAAAGRAGRRAARSWHAGTRRCRCSRAPTARRRRRPRSARRWRTSRTACARARERIAAVTVLGKINGAVGNYNAHVIAYPGFDWERFCRRFVERLGLEFNPYTTQIEPHDWLAELLDAYARANSVLLDLDRDLWGYISLGYFRQKTKAGEVGSSTMPHKVNPIDFENSEGNVGIANALLRHLAEKLPVSRWQRDLSDSTALRNVGTALGHTLLAYGVLPARPRQARGRPGAPRRRPRRELGSARRGGAAGDAPPRRAGRLRQAEGDQPRQAPRPARSSPRSSRRCRSRPRRRSACSR